MNRAAFRRRRNFYAAAATELGARPISAAARALTGSPTPPRSWRRGLILSHSHLGDVLYRTCSLAALSDGLPECEWFYLVTPSAAELLAGNTAVQALPLLTEAGRLRPGAVGGLAARGFGAVLCSNTFRTWADLRLALRLRIPNRAAFTHKGLSGLVTHPVTVDYPSPYPAYFQQMVSQLVGRAPKWPLRPVVFVDAEDRRKAESAVRELGIGGDFAVCAPGTRQLDGAAPPRFVARVVAEVASQTRLPVLLCGSAAERSLLEEIARRASIPPLIVADSLPLRALVALLGRAHAVISQDSGPRHLANAAGVPVAFFRNMAVPQLETGAYCPTEIDVAPPGELLSAAAVARAYDHADSGAVAQKISAIASAESDRRPATPAPWS